jgi:hypothetical protein
MSSIAHQTCPGCLRTFSACRGLSSHLQQATNQRCKAILQEIKNNIAEASDQDNEHSEGPEIYWNDESDMDDAPAVFGGDFFGSDYGPADFPGWDDSNTNLDDHNSEDEDSQSDAA